MAKQNDLALSADRTRWRRRDYRILAACAALLLLAGPASAAEICVQLARDGRIHQSIPAAAGGDLRLRFRHSIYGSEVEELFHVQPDGLQLVQLRYAEARLAEFYGHDNAKYDDGAWIFRPAPALLRSLDLRLSPEAAMSLIIGTQTNLVQLVVPSGAALRVTVAPCVVHRDG